LFDAIEVFNCNLIPRSESVPSPIPREDDFIENEVLDITPIDFENEEIQLIPERTSSPNLPKGMANIRLY
jgi:hypothetical protein